MAKISFFAIHPEMIQQANQASEMLHLPLAELKLVETASVIEEAKKSFSNGADIIIARGSQASLIRQYTSIPVVDIVLTGQEISLLVCKAKEMLRKEQPVIGMIGFQNMFCDTTYFNQIFHVTLKKYFAQYSDEIPAVVDLAVSEGVDFIIGGDKALQCAQRRGIPSLFLTSTQDSINEAFRVAKKVAYVSDIEKKNNAELSTLLDYSFNGIIKIDPSGLVVALNHIAQNYLKPMDGPAAGKPIGTLIPEINDEILGEVLKGGRDIHSLFFTAGNMEIVANLAPVKVANTIEGAILSCHEIKKVEEISAKTQLELYKSGRKARYNFSRLGESSSRITKVVSLAKRYACCDEPILIEGEIGTEKELLAECIHNASIRSDRAFISIDCASLTEEEQDRLFSSDGTPPERQVGSLLEAAQHGTLFLDRIENLNLPMQERLAAYLRTAVLSDRRPVPDIRMIAGSVNPLYSLSQKGQFSQSLYYMLAALMLNIPPLYKRPEDITYWADRFFDNYCTRYSRYLTLTDDAKQVLASYRWPGNVAQLDIFCRRLVINAVKKNVDDDFVCTQLKNAYPERPCEPDSENPSCAIIDLKATELATLMDHYSGNRILVAKALGVSKTTLWRRLKKYQL